MTHDVMTTRLFADAWVGNLPYLPVNDSIPDEEETECSGNEGKPLVTQVSGSNPIGNWWAILYDLCTTNWDVGSREYPETEDCSR